MRTPSNKPYYFKNKKSRPAIEVRFAHIPGRWFSTGTKDMAEAVLFAERRLRDDSLLQPKEIPTLNEFAKDYFMKDGPGSFREADRKYKRKRAPRYYDKAQAMLDNHILPRFGSMLVTAISTGAVEEWLPEIRLKNGKPAADNTKNKILFTFRCVMDSVKKAGYRKDNPARDVKAITAEYDEREPLSPEEAETLFPESPEERVRIWHGEMWALYFSIFYDTGMRPGEIAALRVCDIYSTPHGLAVATRRAVNTGTGKIYDKVKTSGKGWNDRLGLLYDDTARLLIQYIRNEKLSGKDLLFRGRRTGRPLDASCSNKHFKIVMKEHGFYREGVVQYALRHTYETERRGDVPDDVLAVTMGHTKLRNDYDHRKPEDLIRMIDQSREGLFVHRQRQKEESDIMTLEEALKKAMDV